MAVQNRLPPEDLSCLVYGPTFVESIHVFPILYIQEDWFTHELEERSMLLMTKLHPLRVPGMSSVMTRRWVHTVFAGRASTLSIWYWDCNFILENYPFSNFSPCIWGGINPI